MTTLMYLDRVAVEIRDTAHQLGGREVDDRPPLLHAVYGPDGWTMSIIIKRRTDPVRTGRILASAADTYEVALRGLHSQIMEVWLSGRLVSTGIALLDQANKSITIRGTDGDFSATWGPDITRDNAARHIANLGWRLANLGWRLADGATWDVVHDLGHTATVVRTPVVR